MVLRRGVARKLGKPEETVEKVPLWHGTPESTVPKITQGKFDRGLSGANGNQSLMFAPRQISDLQSTLDGQRGNKPADNCQDDQLLGHPGR